MMALVVMLSTFTAALVPRMAIAQEAWDYTPYRIRVWLAVRPSAEIGPLLRHEIIQTLVVQAPVYGGATWQLEAEEAPETIRYSVLAALDDLTVAQIRAAREDALVPDKVMLLSVCEQAGEFLIACRELDCRTRTLGETVHARTWHRARLARGAADVVADTFAPLVRVESSRGRKASVRMRASGLVRYDHCPSLVKSGDVLRPIIRRNDRRGEPKPGGIEVLDWTYLLVREQQEYLQECDVYSASRNPLVGRSSLSVERMALRVRPRGSRTELQLLARGEPAAPPLEGYSIFAKLPVADGTGDPYASERLGVTDWRGMIVIERTDSPLRLIYVKNGTHLIARLPMVPGLMPREAIALPSDDKRLEAEAFVKGMESTVMDLVARREILASRIRRRIQEGKVDQARQLLDEIKAFQTKEDLEMLIAGRQAGLTSADARQQQRINQMLSGTRMLLHKYLDPEQLVALQREVDAAAQKPPAARAEESGGAEPASTPVLSSARS
ncbi:MAG: hypothetical protein ACYC4B_11750 [Pirellulaceae bacterium]